MWWSILWVVQIKCDGRQTKRWCMFSQPATGSGITRLLQVSASQGFFQKVVGMCQCISAFRTSIFHWLKASAGCTLPFMRLAALGDIGELEEDEKDEDGDWVAFDERGRLHHSVIRFCLLILCLTCLVFHCILLNLDWDMPGSQQALWPVVSYEFQWVWANKYSPFQWNPQLTTGLPVFKRSHLSGARRFGYIQPLVFGGVTLPLFHTSRIPCFFLHFTRKVEGLLIAKKILTAGSPRDSEIGHHHFQVPCGCFQE